MRPAATSAAHRAVLAAALAAVALIAGCGGGGDGGGTSGDALSKEELVKQGDAICSDGQAQFRTIQKKPPRDATQAEKQTGKLVAVAEGEVAKLRRLVPPADLAAGYKAYLKAREQGIAILRRGYEAAKANDARGFFTSQAEVAAGQKTRYDLARKVGFTTCSKPPAGSTGAGSGR